LHATKDEIVQVFKLVLQMLTKQPLTIKSDCAPEYHTPELLLLFTEYGVTGKEVRHCNEHYQAKNGMVEIFGDSSLDNDTPFCRRTGRLPDFSFFRPFGCGMVVFRGRDLVEPKKLAPRGERCVYIGTGRQFGRRASMGYSPRTNRVYASVESATSVSGIF